MKRLVAGERDNIIICKERAFIPYQKAVDKGRKQVKSMYFHGTMKQASNRQPIILGIDPGSLVMGYALLQADKQQPRVLLMDVLKLSNEKDIYARLHLIHEKVSELIRLYRPSSFAIEAPFFGKNVQSMLKLGRAQGVAIAAAMQAGIGVTEYSPKKVKQSITGNGNANKEQVWRMLKTILQIDEQPRYFDASDALSVALCHHFNQKIPVVGVKNKKVSGWEEFARQFPDRVTKK
jgi:crossover junction endodeoxyribonuclease RuvC